MLASYRDDYRWLTDVYESVRPTGITGRLVWHALGAKTTVLITQYAKKDRHQQLGSGVHADAIMDHIAHNTIWVDTGSHNMPEHATLNQ